MSYVKETLDFFDKSHSGKTQYLPLVKSPLSNELSKLGNVIFVGKGIYLTLAGNSGSGKTAILDSEFILKLYFWWKNNDTKYKPYWIYRSLERPTKFKIAKWICYLLYVEHGFIMDVPTFFGFPNKMYTLNDVHKKLIKSYEKWFTDEFERHITIYSGSTTPTIIANDFVDIMYKKGNHYLATSDSIFINGKKVKDFTKNNIDDSSKRYWEVVNGEKILQGDNKYKAFDENEIVIHCTDHINAMSGNDERITIKTHSANCRTFRDIFGAFVINISQMNRGQDNPQRKYNKDTTLDIVESDLKGSSAPYEDSDVVLGMINPYKHGITGDYRDYSISKMVNKGYNRFRQLKIMKNSYGLDDLRLGFCFLGEMGMMMELPTGKDMKEEHYELIRKNKILKL